MQYSASYQTKFGRISPGTLFPQLNEESRLFLRDRAFELRFTLQELRLASEIARDLQMWQQGGIADLWPKELPNISNGCKKQLFQQLRAQWEQLRDAPNRYSADGVRHQPLIKATTTGVEKKQLGLGYCPVASPKTRCCNLLTLDMVDNCGYGCSYCSIQSFYGHRQITFDRRFAEKLAALTLDPEQTYHIGTGQSSDSLMWGNSGGMLDAVIAFAADHPNVILEFKTKSANIEHLLKQQLPANIICTWSLNPPPIITHEEKGTASLEKRLDAARRLADKGTLVGFHFHPMIQYEGWDSDYPAIIESLLQKFEPQQVAMVSLGTLTFIKPVIRRIRELGMSSKILKLSLVEADGKLSYPDDVKIALFSCAYASFSPAWKQAVFFYLCMENQRFWKPVFGFDYPSNDEFEASMKHHYMEKIGARR